MYSLNLSNITPHLIDDFWEEVFKDGRHMMFGLVPLIANSCGYRYYLGNKSEPQVEIDGNIYSIRVLDRRKKLLANFFPSKHKGIGRRKNNQEAINYIRLHNFWVVDVTEYPLIHHKIITSEEILASNEFRIDRL
jgi:hypothetical protein